MSYTDANFFMLGDRIQTSKEGRVCKLKGCKAILSIYNHGQYCNAHKRTLYASGDVKMHRFMKGGD